MRTTRPKPASSVCIDRPTRVDCTDCHRATPHDDERLDFHTAMIGQPSVARKLAWRQEELERNVAARERCIDVAELLGLMHDNQIQLWMLDVRPEPGFNQFHLLDAQQVTLAQLESDFPATLPADAVGLWVVGPLRRSGPARQYVHHKGATS